MRPVSQHDQSNLSRDHYPLVSLSFWMVIGGILLIGCAKVTAPRIDDRETSSLESSAEVDTLSADMKELSSDLSSEEKSALSKVGVAVEVPEEQKKPTTLNQSDPITDRIAQLQKISAERRQTMLNLIGKQGSIRDQMEILTGECPLKEMPLERVMITATATVEDDRVFEKNSKSGSNFIYLVEEPDQLKIQLSDDIVIELNEEELSGFFKGNTVSKTDFSDKFVSDIDYIEVLRSGFRTHTSKGVKTYPDGWFGQKLLRFDRYHYHEMARYTLTEIKVQITSGSQDYTIYNRVDLQQPFYWPIGLFRDINLRNSRLFLDVYQRRGSDCAE